jgi:hypothetical protein
MSEHSLSEVEEVSKKGLSDINEVNDMPSSIESSENEMDVNEDNPQKLAEVIQEGMNSAILENPTVLKRLFNIFTKDNATKEGDLSHEALLIQRINDSAFIKDSVILDRIESENLQLYSPITRHHLRKISREKSSSMATKTADGQTLKDLCFVLIERNVTAVGQEENQLLIFCNMLKLVLNCLEFGFFQIQDMRNMVRLFFLKSEQIHKKEEFIMQNQENYNVSIFESLMACKSTCSRILLQLMTLINDDWLYCSYYSLKQTPNSEEEGRRKAETKEGLCRKKNNQIALEKEHTIFMEDNQYYSLFSFIMFNYLFAELKKDDIVFTCKSHKQAMSQLLLFVYNHKEDSFVVSLELFKPEYLPCYACSTMEEEHLERCQDILHFIGEIRKKFKLCPSPNSEFYERMEQGITHLFGEIEILMGLQDETYAIRLLLTEHKVPQFLLEIFVCMQDMMVGVSCDELFIQGLKVLYQMCRGNYPGQTQITKGEGWEALKKLIKGNFSVFLILLLKQLFEEDSRYLHINTSCAIELLQLYSESFDGFFANFTYDQIITNSKILVSLYSFELLLGLFLNTKEIGHHIRQSYNLPIAQSLHKMAIKFAFPLFTENHLQMEQYYEPKLINKNWKLEDGSFLVSLMMLTGNHIKCMVVDFAFSIIKLYNKACEFNFPGSFYHEIAACLPLDSSCLEYLFTFADGLKFKTELNNSYCIFRIFAQSSRILEKYSNSELSLHASDTNKDYMPECHISAIPKLIIEEVTKFQRMGGVDFEKEDIMDYLIRGICQMSLKYVNGIIWFYSSIDSEDNIKIVSRHIHELNQKFHSIKMVINETKKSVRSTGVLIDRTPMKKFLNDANLGIDQILVSSISTLIGNIQSMMDGTNYIALYNRYELNTRYLAIQELKVVKEILACDASFQALKNQHAEPEDPIQSGELEKLSLLVKSYKDLKKSFLQDPKKNRFYAILQSKMENVNQRNLISCLVNALDSLDTSVTSYNSIWFDKSAIQLITFLNNTMFWSTKTRSKLFDYFEMYPKKRDRIISAIYKGLRETFAILAYSPFYNDQWEVVFSKYYMFCTFIRGTCKQNCQEFKTFYGEFVPAFDCPNHRRLNHTVLFDLAHVMNKFLHFSGLSFNKSAVEKPSDRLSTINITELLMRCMIDFLTGPCKSNQVKIYSLGNLIWLSMFHRGIADLDSKYYVLVNIVLDYLLSLLEGNNQVIMSSFSTTFDIPLLYSYMVKLLTLLWKRFRVRKRKHTSSEKSETRPLDLKEKTLIRQRMLQDGEKSNRESSLQLVTKDDDLRMNNWQDLIYMYMSGDFENHVTLEVSIKIFIFLSRVAYTSKKYQIFFDKKEKDLQEQYVKNGFKEEDIKASKVALTGYCSAPEELIVYYFLKNITARVEIKDGNYNSEMFIFPKPPCCFFLKEATIENFITTCQFENTEAKLIDMFDNFDQFHLEMQNYQKFKSKYRALGWLATDNSFTLFRIICYLLCVAINLLLMFYLEFGEPGTISTVPSSVTVLSAVLIFTSASFLLLWIVSNYMVVWSATLKKFTIKHPYKNPFFPTNMLLILWDIFCRREVVNFLLHVLIALLGLLVSPIYQVSYYQTDLPFDTDHQYLGHHQVRAQGRDRAPRSAVRHHGPRLHLHLHILFHTRPAVQPDVQVRLHQRPTHVQDPTQLLLEYCGAWPHQWRWHR